MFPQIYDTETWKAFHEYRSERAHADAMARAKAEADAKALAIETKTKAESSVTKATTSRPNPVNAREERSKTRDLFLARTQSQNHHRDQTDNSSASEDQSLTKEQQLRKARRHRPAQLYFTRSRLMDTPESCESPLPNDDSVDLIDMLEITGIHSSRIVHDNGFEWRDAGRVAPDLRSNTSPYGVPISAVPQSAPAIGRTRSITSEDPRFGSSTSLESTSLTVAGEFDASPKRVKKWGLFRSKTEKDPGSIKTDIDDQKSKSDLPTKSFKLLKKGKDKASTPRDPPASAKDFEKENTNTKSPEAVTSNHPGAEPVLTAEELGKVNAYFAPSPKITPRATAKLTPSNVHAPVTAGNPVTPTLSTEELAKVNVHYSPKAKGKTTPSNIHDPVPAGNPVTPTLSTEEHAKVNIHYSPKAKGKTTPSRDHNVGNVQQPSRAPAKATLAPTQQVNSLAETSAVQHGPKHYPPGTPIDFPVLRNPPRHTPDVPVDVDEFEDDFDNLNDDYQGPIFFTMGDFDPSEGDEVECFFLDSDPYAEASTTTRGGHSDNVHRQGSLGFPDVNKLRISESSAHQQGGATITALPKRVTTLPKRFISVKPIDEMTDDDLDSQ